MAKILVTGANGQLGSEFRELAPAYSQHEFYFCSRADLDVSSMDSVRSAFSSFKPDYCINCAAYTAVDKAETEPAAAFSGNANAVKNLAEACVESGAKFIHISTDYVFDGNGTEPFKEDHPTAPINVYGQSKLQGELDAMAANPQSVIIRTSWVYSTYGNNFVKTMIRLMQSRPEVNVVADQKGSPTYAADLAAAILHIISGKWQAGIYHYSNSGVITWFQFAQAIQELTGAPCTVHPIPSAAYPTPAKRPFYSVMDTQKIRSVYNLEIRDWKISLQECLAKIDSLQPKV